MEAGVVPGTDLTEGKVRYPAVLLLLQKCPNLRDHHWVYNLHSVDL